MGIFYRDLTSSLKLFNKRLETTLDTIQREKKYSYIMDDFNVNCIEEFSDSNIYSQQFINMLLSHYYLKLINIPTRITQNNASLLDNIFMQIHQLGTMVFSRQILVIIIQFSQSDRMWNLRYLTNIVIKENSQIKIFLNLRKNFASWIGVLLSFLILFSLTFPAYFSIITDLFNSSFPVKQK